MKENSKSENRNPKQIRIPKTEYDPEQTLIRISFFGFISSFEFRVSSFTLP
jgi:hypothetical protein